MLAYGQKLPNTIQEDTNLLTEWINIHFRRVSILENANIDIVTFFVAGNHLEMLPTFSYHSQLLPSL